MTNEAENPELYENETRTVCDAAGMDRVVTMQRIYWGSFDFITQNTEITAGELIAIAEEEAPQHGMTWHDYLPEGLAHIDHWFAERPELWNANRGKGELVGYIGPASKVQIDAIEKQKTPATGNDADA